jgi:sigma-B regulation protein RsbU (phosphoserine phosphatase)
MESRELSSASPTHADPSPDAVPAARMRNMFVARIKICPGWIGGLALGNKGHGPFPSPQRKLARAIAEQAGGQIENVLLYQESLKKARLETEMELARSVQMRLMPQRLPSVPGLDIWAGSRPALHVGGDFYDFVNKPNSPLTFAAGDVSGKGAPAALLMSMAHAVFRSAVGVSASSPADIIDHANTHLYDDLGSVAAFLTLFVGQYDVRQRRLSYANAGHSPVVFCPVSRPAQLLEADGPAVGVLPVAMSENHVLALVPGDVLVVATDGFNEAQREGGGMYGIDRLTQLTEALAGGSAQEIALGLYAGVEEFAGGRPQDDDQTLMVLKAVPI